MEARQRLLYTGVRRKSERLLGDPSSLQGTL